MKKSLFILFIVVAMVGCETGGNALPEIPFTISDLLITYSELNTCDNNGTEFQYTVTVEKEFGVELWYLEIYYQFETDTAFSVFYIENFDQTQEGIAFSTCTRFGESNSINEFIRLYDTNQNYTNQLEVTILKPEGAN